MEQLINLFFIIIILAELSSESVRTCFKIINGYIFLSSTEFLQVCCSFCIVRIYIVIIWLFPLWNQKSYFEAFSKFKRLIYYFGWWIVISTSHSKCDAVPWITLFNTKYALHINISLHCYKNQNRSKLYFYFLNFSYRVLIEILYTESFSI